MNIPALIVLHSECSDLLKNIQSGKAILKSHPGDKNVLSHIEECQKQYADRLIKISGPALERMLPIVHRHNCVTIAEEFYQ